MADEQKTVSVEEFNQLAEKYKELEAKNAKLSKIFEERQTKTLDKEGISYEDVDDDRDCCFNCCIHIGM